MLGAPEGRARPARPGAACQGLRRDGGGAGSVRRGEERTLMVSSSTCSPSSSTVRAELSARFDAFDGDLHFDAGGVHVGGQAEGVDAAAVYGLEPDGLPDPGRTGVEDTLGLLLPVLLAPRDGHVPTTGLRPALRGCCPRFARERVCHIGGERRVSTLVGGYLRAVHPDRRAVVHGAEVEQEPLVARRGGYSKVRAYQTTSWKAVSPMPESFDW